MLREDLLLHLLALLCTLATSTASEGLINRFAHLIFDLLGLLAQKGVTFSSLHSLLLLLPLHRQKLALQLANSHLPVSYPGLALHYARLRSLKLLLKQDYLLFMAFGQVLHSLLVASLDSSHLTV